MTINHEAINLGDCYQVKCRQCGRLFEAQRASAEFCGGSCRGKHHRIKRKREDTIARAKAAVKLVIQNMPQRGNSQEYLALQDLRTIIMRGLSGVQEK